MQLNTFYSELIRVADDARKAAKKPLTLAEKILYAHAVRGGGRFPAELAQRPRGEFDCVVYPDRVDMQDATAQMAILQLLAVGAGAAAVPGAVHCDHLVIADRGASADVATAKGANDEVYRFLEQAAARFGLDLWRPGAGIIHQIVLENYAVPGGLLLGTDSHTPNSGGVAMLGVGGGGADAVDVLAGFGLELRFPRIVGVKLTGTLSPWATPKDLIQFLAAKLTTKGGTGKLLEYFGEGVGSLAATGRAAVCNMGAELGATSSLFPFDEVTAAYLEATGRADVANAARAAAAALRADDGAFYDEVIEVDLSALEPLIAGPFTPDLARGLGALPAEVAARGWPGEVSAALIGSCTSSSFEDLARVAALAKWAAAQGLKCKVPTYLSPGSARIARTLESHGLLAPLRAIGVEILANACGPCAGQWKREAAAKNAPNSIVTSFNRNFAARNDGSAQTHAFLASAEVTLLYGLGGSLREDPRVLVTPDGRRVAVPAPDRLALPPRGFAGEESGDRFRPGAASPATEVPIDPQSERLQRLQPFAAVSRAADFAGLAVLTKVKGKCTTDHICMAGPWMRFRGHLANISGNLLIGALSAFTGRVNEAWSPTAGSWTAVPVAAAALRAAGRGWVIVAEENYGEGSSREHAALVPRFLGGRAVIAKSFARIHERNLKKQGVVPLVFADPADYDRIKYDDLMTLDLSRMAETPEVTAELRHADGRVERITLRHRVSPAELAWIDAGSALNTLARTPKQRGS